MCIFLCRHLFSSFFCKCQGAQLLGHMVRVCLVYKKPPICLPKCLYYFASLPAMYERSCCSIPSPAFGVVSVLDIDHFNRCIVVSLLFYCSIVALFFFYNFSYLFIFSSARFSLLHGLCSSCGEQRCSSCGVRVSYWDCLSCWEVQAVRTSVLWLLGSGAWAQ